MEHTTHKGTSGNIYHIIHGWFEQEDKEFYFFSWMRSPLRGHSFSVSKQIKIKELGLLEIAGLLNFSTTKIQSTEILEFVIKEFERH